MKYVIFGLAVLAVIPAAYCCSLSKAWFGRLMVCLMIPVLFQRFSAINFLSYETYHGTSRGMEVSLAYLAAFVILFALKFQGRRLKWLPDFGSWMYLLYFIWSCLSLQNCANVEYGWLEIWKMIMMGLVFAAVYNWLESGGKPASLMTGFAVVLVYNFFTVVLQHVTGVWQAPGTFQHQNSLALYALMAAPLFLSRYLNAASAGESRVALGVFVCGAACLVRTFSRGAIACFPIAGLVTVALCFLRNFKACMATRMLPLVIAGMMGAAALLPLVIIRFETASKKSGEGRIEFARCAVNMMKDEPVFGVGINNWGIKINPPYTYWVGTGRRTIPGENNDDFKDGIVETVYLLVGSECGIPALIIMLVWYAYNLCSCVTLCRRLSGTSLFYLPAGIAGGLTGCYLQSCLEWVLKQATSFCEMMVLFAVVSYLNKNWRRLRDQERIGARA